MRYLNHFIIKQVFLNVAQIIILLLLALLTSGMFFFVRFSIDSNEAVINQYISDYGQEDFRFTINGDNIFTSEDEYLDYLLSKYEIKIERREFVKCEDNDFTYYIINSMTEINVTNIIEGALPEGINEIAMPYKYMEMMNLNIGDELEVRGNAYTIVGSVSLPDYILFQPYSELQKDYSENSFVIVSDELMELFRDDSETIYYCGLVDNGDKDEVLAKLRNEDGIENLEDAAAIESDSAPSIAFESNKSLAYAFLFSLTLVSAFVYYLFISKYIKRNRKLLGTIQALGYKNMNIVCALLLATVPVIGVGGVIGLFLGGKLSMVLINRYIETYMFTNFGPGISAPMVFLGLLTLPIVCFLMVNICCAVMLSEETALLMRAERIAKESRIYNKFVSVILKKCKSENIFSYKTIFRKKSNIVLTIVAMLSVGALFITSISLYFSSTTVFDRMFKGQEYKYCYSTDYYHENIDNADCFQDTKATVSIDGELQSISVYGVNNDSQFFHLYDANNNVINPDSDSVIISEGYSVINSLRIGDVIEIQFGKTNKEFVISGICQNGYLNNMYVAVDTLSSIIGTEVGTSNIFYSDQKLDLQDATVVTISEEIKAAEYNQSSNKSSAVINQVIGILFAILMFFLVIILIIDENVDNLKILQLLGYTDNKAYKMVLGKYRPFICIILCITYPLAIYVSYLMHIGISKSTNDYICFSTNIFVFCALFIVVNIAYSLVFGTYGLKFKR